MALRVRRLYRQMKNTTNAMKGEKRLAAKLYKLARDYGVTTDNGVPVSYTHLLPRFPLWREVMEEIGEEGWNEA